MKNWFRKFLYIRRLRTLMGDDGLNVTSRSVSRRTGQEEEEEETESPDSVAAEVVEGDGGGGGAISGGGRRRKSSVAVEVPLRRWEADFQLEQIDRLHLFDEYIEMGT